MLKLIKSTECLRGGTRVPRKNCNFCYFCDFSKNCEKLEKSQFLLKLIKSSVTYRFMETNIEIEKGVIIG